MIESPLLQEVVAHRVQERILRVLDKRFGGVPPELTLAIRAELDETKLFDLYGEALMCTDLASFQARLSA